MNKSGPIIVVEDDIDDQEIFSDALNILNYKNEVLFFPEGEKALDYLTETNIEPFIIFADINMPGLNGLELQQKIQDNEYLRLKSMPYLFFTTSSEEKHIIEAYSKSVQGFFVKPSNFHELKDTIKYIIEYWQRCISPHYSVPLLIQ